MADEPNRYACPFCADVFYNFSSWQRHRYEAHRGEHGNPPKPEPMVPPKPKPEDDDRRWECLWCDRDVATFELLGAHLKVCDKYQSGHENVELSQGVVDLTFWQIRQRLNFEIWLHEQGRS